jgi:hypothetical protein
LYYSNIAFFVHEDILITQVPTLSITLHVLNLSLTNLQLILAEMGVLRLSEGYEKDGPAFQIAEETLNLVLSSS